jgi:hypothetical protein
VALVHAVAPDASMRTMLVAARLSTVVIPALVALWFVLKRTRSSFALTAVTGLFLGSVVHQGSVNFSGHVPSTIAILSAAYLIGTRRIALAGLLAGLAILIDFTTAIAAAGLLLVLALRTRSVRPVAIFAFWCALIASIQLAVNAICFGGPLDFAYDHMFNPADQANRGSAFFGIALPRAEAIFGLTFGGMKGMFLHSPFLLLAMPALVAALRRRRDAIHVWSASMCIIYFFLVASLRDWEGGWSLGPRYLTLVYPLLVFLLVVWFENDVSERWRVPLQVALAATVTWSVLLHVIAMLTWPNPPVSTLLTFPALEVPAFLVFRRAFAANLLAAVFPAVIAAAIVLAIAMTPVVINAGRRALPYVAIAALLFAIALSSAAPAAGSPLARRFEVFLYYMGYEKR